MKIADEFQVAAAIERFGRVTPRVVASGNFATPVELISILDATLERYRLFMLNAQPQLPDRSGVVLESPFVGQGMRAALDRLDYLPMRLSLVPKLFSYQRPPDIVLVHTSTVHDNKVSLGIEVNILVAAIEHARARGGLVIAQLNPSMPYTLGDGEISCDMIDLGLEYESPLLSPSPHPGTPEELAIGAHVASLVEDGATLQMGIGAVPDATLAALDKRRGLSVWSEMISDGILALERGGALDVRRQLVTSFLFGSPELYAWVDHNPRVRLVRTETTNDPALIARQPQMTSVNTALQIDLYAQANASRVHNRIYSGFGGQPDFVEGALHSSGGRAVIALKSWHDKSDHSSVVPCLDGQVTSFQHSAIVSEQGVARLFGASQHRQAEMIIDHVAHPRARAELHEAAAEMGILRAPLKAL